MTVSSGFRQYFDELPSTQSTARTFAHDGSPPGTWIIAAAQTDGVGRGEKRWESPPGGLYLSIIARAPEPNVALVPLATGVAIADVLERGYAVRTRLKWPNDLIVEDSGRMRKLAGILVDRLFAPWGDAVVIGVGINVLGGPEQFGGSLADRATTLEALSGSKPSIEGVEGRVVPGTLEAIDRLRQPSEVARVMARIRRALYGVGRMARVDGKRTGVVEGIGPDGELLVACGPDLHAIRSGDVAIEAAP